MCDKVGSYSILPMNCMLTPCTHSVRRFVRVVDRDVLVVLENNSLRWFFVTAVMSLKDTGVDGSCSLLKQKASSDFGV